MFCTSRVRWGAWLMSMTICSYLPFATPGQEQGEDTGSEEQQDPSADTSELDALLAEFEAEEAADAPTARPNYADPKFDFLDLGVNTNYARQERFRLRDQILTFIPPLYQPAFVGHGYVLPPNTWRVSFGTTFFDVEPNDFFKHGKPDVAHQHHSVSRTRVDLDIFYGLDRDFTLRVNVPYFRGRSGGSVHPAGVLDMDLFVEGEGSDVGDISVFLKKKLWDQANLKFNLAVAGGIRFPTGANDKKFDQPMVVRDPMGALGVAFGGGPFQRFSDDGRLPAVLQPGTGDFAYHAGVFATRQFTRHRAAIHAGALATFIGSEDGIDPGDELRFFVSYVKPIYSDYVSLELAINGMDKQADSYEGTFGHPVPDPVTGLLAGFAVTPRPAFREGTIVFATPSVIIVPNPWLRFTFSGMFRLNEPDLGPWPDSQVKLTMNVTF